ncbi:DgyrCDS5303 [Dimorphilus gyrociliatus]|uniref:DgyrCDS5303 n=1 Tax=Dimorphilus gyrociliatus TaxID=2664684 RepID=A0A7I8VK63_9ANNE|nr:DgyrCDS5303 [Dimorphilus gyrociliatus]
MPKFAANNKKRKNEEISSDSESESDGNVDNAERETAAEKRLRLAKNYLAQLRAEELSKREESDSDEDGINTTINKRLKDDRLFKEGILQRNLADSYSKETEVQILKNGHMKSVTCIEVTTDLSYLYSGSKDGLVIKWNINDNYKREKKYKLSHSILCMSLNTPEDTYLAVGGCDKNFLILNTSDFSLRHTFMGHKIAITALKFRRNSSQLFSASQDKLIKVWNTDEMSYVETLFGHESAVNSLDSLVKERAISCGGYDKSIRIWKIIDESQLVFHYSNCTSIECVSYINEDYFVSGSDDNSIQLWSVLKKKPIYVHKEAHPGPENWITSIAALSFSDLIASGSKDGFIRLWKCGPGYKSLENLFSVEIQPGFVNNLRFHGDSLLTAAIGQEHKCGRWWKVKGSKNCLAVIKLKNSLEQN